MRSLFYAYVIFAALFLLLLATGCASPVAFEARRNTNTIIVVQPEPTPAPIESLPELREAPTGVCSITTYLDVDSSETLTDEDQIITVNDDACADDDSDSEDKPDKKPKKDKKDKQDHDKSGGK